ncbi:hypothetical protein BH23CHL7_BH23CHL7_24030 [soil metagenome]
MKAAVSLRIVAAYVVAALSITACTLAAPGSQTSPGSDATADATATPVPPATRAPAPAATADKGGGNVEGTVTLRLGTEDDAGRPGADQIRRFADEVNALSGGRIVIEPVWDANGEDNLAGWDQAVARMAVAGELDMALIPARAWDTEGVTSLRALHAPFLVTSDELAATLATDEIAGEMLAGLDGIGVKGLALFPETLRHLIVYSDLPESTADFSGMAVRSPRSQTTWALFEALSAMPDDFTDPGESFDDIVAAGGPAAAETSFALAGTLPSGTSALGNLPLFPKINSLVVNSSAYGRLSEEQQAILEQAATRAVESSVSTMRGTTEYAQEFCRNGGQVVMLDDALVVEIHAAASVAYNDLAADAQTQDFIDRIRRVAGRIGAAPAIVEPCGPPVSAGEPVRATGDFPEGVYRKEITVEQLVAAGIDRPTAQNHMGTWTIGFRDGVFSDLGSGTDGCPGSTYTITEGRISVRLGPVGPACGGAAGQVLFEAAWSVEGDQLRFVDVRSGHGFDLLIANLFGGAPWTKID